MFGRMRERMTFANTMSLIAVFVALGGTSYAAVKIPRNSVSAAQIKAGGVGSSEVKNGALRIVDFKASELTKLAALPGMKGDKGDKGEKGDKGDPGQDGAAGAPGPGSTSAFARVQANGTLQPDVAGFPSQNKGTILVSKGEGGAATGTYCFDLESRPASAIVSLDNADAGANVDLIASVAIDRGEDLGDCPANRNDARVRIVDTDLTAGGAEQDPGAADARFFIWFEL